MASSPASSHQHAQARSIRIADDAVVALSDGSPSAVPQLWAACGDAHGVWQSVPADRRTRIARKMAHMTSIWPASAAPGADTLGRPASLRDLQHLAQAASAALAAPASDIATGIDMAMALNALGPRAAAGSLAELTSRVPASDAAAHGAWLFMLACYACVGRNAQAMGLPAAAAYAALSTTHSELCAASPVLQGACIALRISATRCSPA